MIPTLFDSILPLVLFASLASAQTTAAPPTAGGPGRAESQSQAITGRQADAILQELRAIRQLLERGQPARPGAQAAAPSPQPVKMTVRAGWHVLGREDAPVTLVEFADYQCPYCRRFHNEVFPEIRKSFIDTGKVRFISRDLPLDFHANAMRAAMAARCAGDQGKYWQMREALVSGAGDLALASIRGYAQGVLPDMLAFDTCLSTEKHKADVQRDAADAASLQVTGTPTFVLGRTGTDVIDGVRLVGAMPFAAMQSAIQQLLAPAGANAGSR